MAYFAPALGTDPEPLTAQVIEDIQARYPDWEPSDGNLEVVLISAIVNLLAELRDVASHVPDDIIRTEGTLLFDTPSQEAAAATGDVNVTVTDTLGYTLPAGTEMAYALTGSESILFATTEDLVIAVGDTDGTVPVQALTDGTDGNDLTGELTLSNPLYEWVDTLEFDAATSGGADAESDADYLARLVARLRLQAPRPILAPDFAVLALDNPSVGHATAVDNLIPGTNEVQSVTINATSGTWTWSHGGQTTSALAYNITASQFQTAIEALSNFLPGDVEVTGGPGATSPLAVEFKGQYAETDVAAATTNAASLSGGTHTATVATVTAGAAANTAAERAVTVYITDDDWDASSSIVRGEVDAMLQAYREVNFLVYVLSPPQFQIAVTSQVTLVTGFDATATLAAVEAALESYFPQGWAEGVFGDEQSTSPWTVDTKVRYLEVAQVINNVEGVAYINSLTIGREGGSLSTSDVTLTGHAPLPIAGTFTLTAA